MHGLDIPDVNTGFRPISIATHGPDIPDVNTGLQLQLQS